jgi:hypothetical protein
MKRMFALKMLVMLFAAACSSTKHSIGSLPPSAASSGEEVRDLDFYARDYNSHAGLPPIRKDEVRIWIAFGARAGNGRGISLSGDELVEYILGVISSPKLEIHRKSAWVRSRLPPESVEEIQMALAGIVELNGNHLDCTNANAFDPDSVLIDANVKGIRVLLEAYIMEESTNDACRSVYKLYRLLRAAAIEGSKSSGVSRP